MDSSSFLSTPVSLRVEVSFCVLSPEIENRDEVEVHYEDG
jgi:hypothetical protein